MLAKLLGHGSDNFFGIVPKNIAAQTDCAAGSLVLRQSLFIERKDLRMFARQPDGRSGCGRAKDDFYIVLSHDVHYPAQPVEIVLALFRLTQAPGKFTD